ncbi:hypothetical protein RRG08_032592 [Elysia crispata]|uniref:Uncharacterized protein n=1 Tax=Elysia crispata TaxID=231223 RepID=A0AAE0ZXH5_9GAST|nr:hypothetical protein RRG08_032592 [Elysia crispata]
MARSWLALEARKVHSVTRHMSHRYGDKSLLGHLLRRFRPQQVRLFFETLETDSQIDDASSGDQLAASESEGSVESGNQVLQHLRKGEMFRQMILLPGMSQNPKLFGCPINCT